MLQIDEIISCGIHIIFQWLSRCCILPINLILNESAEMFNITELPWLNPMNIWFSSKLFINYSNSTRNFQQIKLPSHFPADFSYILSNLSPLNFSRSSKNHYWIFLLTYKYGLCNKNVYRIYYYSKGTKI